MLRLPKNLRRLLLICTTLLGFTSIILTFVEFFTFPNFVYSRLRIHYDQLGLVALLLGIVYLATIEPKIIKKHLSSLVFYAGPILLLIFFVMQFWPRDFFLKLVQEDNVIEYFQFVVLVLGAAISGLVSYFYKRRDQNKAIIFSIVAAVLLLAAGDEISWGQRLLSITTPEFIGNQNTQNEITIHNNYGIDGLVKWGYVLVGFYGAYA